MRVPAFMLDVRPPLEEVMFDPWSDLEWAQHIDAMRAVANHPEGMTLEQIGSYMGITRERVRQIEAGALRKLKQADGFSVLIFGGIDLAIPDCERCGMPFVRANGRSRRCESCATQHRRRSPSHRLSAGTQPAAPPSNIRARPLTEPALLKPTADTHRNYERQTASYLLP